MKKAIVCLTAVLLMASAASCSGGGSGESAVSSSAPSSSASSAASASSASSLEASEGSSASSSVSSPSSAASSEGKTGLQEDGSYLGDGYSCTAPEGWKLLEEDSSQATFVPENYPEESVDTISVQVTEKDPAFDSYTREDFEKEAEKKYASLEAFQFSDFKEDVFEGYDMYVLEYSLTKDGVPMKFQQYFIDAPQKTVCLLFTEVNGSDITKARDAFLENLKVQ